MNAAKLISDLRNAGYVLRAAAGKINVKGPGEALPSDVRAQILEVRDEVLHLLEAEEADRVRVVPAQEWIDDLVATGQLPPVEGDPWVNLRRKPTASDRRADPLPLAQLRLMPITGVVARLCLTADRLGRLIEMGRGDSEEAQELQAERDWIGLHRPEAWDAPVRPPPP